MEFLNYFSGVFEPYSMLLLLGGTIGGLILGATPGLSPTMAVALLIPFTFHLQPIQGLILLGAAYTSTVAGGAVSAILLKIPGAPANIATTLDGHKMAQKGEGARALQLSFLASFIGGVTGVLLLIFLTPLLAEWALAFGPSHLFWLAIVGVAVIASLDSISVVKGLLSGCIGLWISTIGFDDILGAQRFVFHPTLSGGVSIIPALIGLFAIPQIIDMFAKGASGSGADIIKIKSHALINAIKEVIIRIRSVILGTVSGLIIGLIPGIGGQIAGLVAYDQAKKFSKTPEKFGTGHPEGVIAAEAANNAMVGPSLVPLLTLSIPGSPTAAVLLGGLLIHGIFPGSDLFDNHPEVAWTFINSMLIGQFVMLVFGLYIAGFAARIAKVPAPVMATIILGLAVFGSYSVETSMGDVYVMFVLGFLMYLFEKFGFSSAPLLLGLILGPIAEANFAQGAIIATATVGHMSYFFGGWLNISLILITLLSIGYSVYSLIMKGKISQKSEGAAASAPIASRWQHTASSGLIAFIALWVCWLSYTTEPADAFLFPRIISVAFVFLALWTWIKAIIGKSKVGVGLDVISVKNILPALIVAVIYIFFAAKFFGFYTALFFTAFILLSLYDGYAHKNVMSWARRLGISAAFVAVMYGLFSGILTVYTPREILF